LKRGIPEDLDELISHSCLQYALYPWRQEWQFDGPDGRAVKVFERRHSKLEIGSLAAFAEAAVNRI
jgi:hypothetical protein